MLIRFKNKIIKTKLPTAIKYTSAKGWGTIVVEQDGSGQVFHVYNKLQRSIAVVISTKRMQRFTRSILWTK